MRAKTISIDDEAYRRLTSIKKKDESFSDAIKRVIQKPINFRRWMEAIEKDPLSDEAVEAVEAVIAGRSIRRPPRPRRGTA